MKKTNGGLKVEVKLDDFRYLIGQVSNPTTNFLEDLTFPSLQLKKYFRTINSRLLFTVQQLHEYSVVQHCPL